MRAVPPVHLYTQDEALLRRVGGLLAGLAAVRPLASPAALESLCDRGGGFLVLADLRADESLAMIQRMREENPLAVIVALGAQGSDPWRSSEEQGVYAAADLDLDRASFQNLVIRAMEHLRLLCENETLRRDAGAAGPLGGRPPPEPEERRGPSTYPGRLCPVGDVETLLHDLVEDVAASTRVSRVGIFCRARDSGNFKLRGGLRCLEGAEQHEYGPRDPLVRWLALNAHVVSRENLPHIRDLDARWLLNQTLDALGAEILFPLQARGRLLGWMFVGHRVTGLPFEAARIEDMAVLAEHVSTTLENALLYEELVVQKTLAETLLLNLPTGIVAVDASGAIRWFNEEAARIFGTAGETVMSRPVETLGSRPADLVRRALSGETTGLPEEWSEGRGGHVLSARAQPLEGAAGCLGAVLLIQDITAERSLKDRQAQVDRAAFWTELAAGMSHEIRNPLTAIKAYAQLLSERYNDAEFRGQFGSIVTQEVERLTGIVEQINRFAHPPRLDMGPLDIRTVVNQGLEAVRAPGGLEGITVTQDMEADLPPVRGDSAALAECVAHLVTNAAEAVRGRAEPSIGVTVRRFCEDKKEPCIAIAVKDNGPGIALEVRDRIFSPFCTTKAKGMGLGLAIVQRVVIDHNGRVHMETGAQGTCMTVFLPVAEGQQK